MSEELIHRQGDCPAEVMRRETDIAGVCGEIVRRTAQTIGRRQYVRVEGWQSIASAHGCMPSIRTVTALDDGSVAAMADLIRIADGAVIASAEGYVGMDEPTWSGRPAYARRAMAQTRAMSRVCRTAFAHIVVMIDANLSTTPAEEVPAEGFIDDHPNGPAATIAMPKPAAPKPAPKPAPRPAPPQQTPPSPGAPAGDWRSVMVHFGNDKGKTLGELGARSLEYWMYVWQPRPYNGSISGADVRLRAAADAARAELGTAQQQPDQSGRLFGASAGDFDPGGYDNDIGDHDGAHECDDIPF